MKRKNFPKVLGVGVVFAVVLGIAFFSGNGESFKGSLNDTNGAPFSNTNSTSLGNLTLTPAMSPVLDDKVASPSTATYTTSNPLLVARYRLYANGEPFMVNRLTVANDAANPQINHNVITAVVLRYPTSMSNPSTLDGLSYGVPVGGVVVFSGLNVAVPVSVTDENAINVEVLVDTAQIGGNNGFNAGSQIELDLNGTYVAVGQNSGEVATDNALLDAPQIALYKTIPTFAKDTSATTVCPTTTLISASQSPIYCLAVTAHVGGDLGLRKLTFDVAQANLNVSKTAGGLWTPNGFKLYQYSSGIINNTVVGQGTWSPNSNKAFINISQEFVVPAGTTKYLVLQAPISFLPTVNASTVSTRLSEEPPAYNTAHQPSTSVAQAMPNRFNIWSDRSVANHSINSADWTHSYKLDQMPTAFLQLIE